MDKNLILWATDMMVWAKMKMIGLMYYPIVFKNLVKWFINFAITLILHNNQ